MSSSDPDPHRTLGLARGASEAEIKRAYRALAKRHHPDAHRGSVARFLEIQAAYEALLGGPPGAGADPAGGVKQGGAPGSGTRRDAAAGGPEWAHRPRGGSARRPGREARSGAGSDTPEGGGAGGGPAGTGAGRSPRAGSGDTGGPRRRGRRRATLGSTSYDEAEEAFEPGWAGAAWYGPSSGTYWTLNPKEYADPRKHGPEYQARARRRADGAPTGPRPASCSAPRAAGGDRAAGGAPDAGGMPAGGMPASAPDTSPARPARAADGDEISPEAQARARNAGRGSGARRATFEHTPAAGERTARRSPTAPPSGVRRGWPAPGATSASTDRARRVPGTAVRIALAIAAWLVPGFWVWAAAGFPAGLVATLPVQVLGVAVLAAAPSVAWATLGGAVALVLALAPIVALVTALGGPFVAGGPAPEGAVVLAGLSWIVGALAVGSGRIAPYPWRRAPRPAGTSAE